MKNVPITESLVRKLSSVIDAGLCNGVGKPVPGKMCVMAAINYALGNDHGDNPHECVGAAVRAYDIRVNDAGWSSSEARAKGMKAEAIAKLGSVSLDQQEFASRLVIQTVKVILPIALRAVLSFAVNSAVSAAITSCESVTTLAEANAAANAAAYAANAAAYAANAADAADAAADAAAYAARAAADAAANAAYAAAANAANAAAADAADAAAYAADAAANAAYAAANAKRDEVLTLASNIAKDILVDTGSEGAKFLYLINE